MTPTEHLDRLRAACAERSARIAVFGLGYVGTPLAATLAASGFPVLGVDVREDPVAAVNAGVNRLDADEPGLGALIESVVAAGRLRATADVREAQDADIFTVNVDTPLDQVGRPDFTSLDAAVGAIGAVLSPGALVIVESTVVPGTTLSRVKPALEETSGLVEGLDFFVGACPERVMPGKLLANLAEVPRVCGGSTPAVSEVMVSFYRTFNNATLDTASPTEAELAKVVENAYRDVQIAFANEVALVCADLDVDVWRVRHLVNKVPHRAMHEPGGGVGGHCIPKDPWLLAAATARDLRLIGTARAINDEMPGEIAALTSSIHRSLASVGSEPQVLILGVSYLPGSGDTRNSPSVALIAELRELGIDPAAHDPYVADFAGDVATMLTGRKLVVKMVAHPDYESVDLSSHFVIDVRRLAEARELARALGVAHA